MMGHSHFRGLAQRLIDDAIALSQANKRTALIFRCVGLQVEVNADTLKSNRRILGDTQSAAKIEIAFGSNRATSNNDAYRRRDGIERHTGAGNKSLKQTYRPSTRLVRCLPLPDATLPRRVLCRFERCK